MSNSRPNVTLDQLRRVHQKAAKQFPHEYFDAGLGAVGLFLHNSPKNAGYRPTPLNSITFASIGVDGIHFGSINDGFEFDPLSPVVVTIPMELERTNYIVGETLYDFLCLGCRSAYYPLANLHISVESTLESIAREVIDPIDPRTGGILRLLSDELSLQPWQNLKAHFDNLQRRFMPTLRLPPPSEK